MYLSRLEPRPGADRRPEFWQTVGDIYRLHQQLWGLFSDHPERRRDFLFRLEEHRRTVRIYTLSARAPRHKDPLWRVQVKPFRPALLAGDQLCFSLRANPVVTREGRRHDVVMEERHRRLKSGTPRSELPTRDQLAQEAGERWLEERAPRWGFTLTGTLRVDSYRLHPLPGKDPKARIATCDFEGRLTLEDPDLFLRRLEQGFGPAKGFGCGLMLLARAGRGGE